MMKRTRQKSSNGVKNNEKQTNPESEASKKRKRISSSSSEGRKNPEMSLNPHLSGSEAEDELRKRFEAEKEKLLSFLSTEYRNLFGTLCFVKWNVSYLPALVISPFDIEPSPIRDQWIAMAQWAQKHKSDPLHLIYWYGSELNEACSLVPKASIKSLEWGLSRGYDNIPNKIQKRIDSGKELSTIQLEHVKGLEYFNNDRKLPPNQRIAWMRNFKETYTLPETSRKKFSNLRTKQAFGAEKKLTAHQLKLKKEFETEKEKDLAKLPTEYKNRFRSLGFVSWRKNYLPVIEISPYDIAPGAVRIKWKHMIDTCLSMNREPLHLIYWYGEDLASGCSLVSKSKIRSLEWGIENGYDKIPLTLQKKIEQGKKLTIFEEQHIKGLEDFNRDLELPLSERIALIRMFEEEYMLDNDDKSCAPDLSQKKHNKNLARSASLSKTASTNNIDISNNQILNKLTVKQKRAHVTHVLFHGIGNKDSQSIASVSLTESDREDNPSCGNSESLKRRKISRRVPNKALKSLSNSATPMSTEAKNKSESPQQTNQIESPKKNQNIQLSNIMPKKTRLGFSSVTTGTNDDHSLPLEITRFRTRKQKNSEAPTLPEPTSEEFDTQLISAIREVKNIIAEKRSESVKVTITVKVENNLV